MIKLIYWFLSSGKVKNNPLDCTKKTNGNNISGYQLIITILTRIEKSSYAKTNYNVVKYLIFMMEYYNFPLNNNIQDRCKSFFKNADTWELEKLEYMNKLINSELVETKIKKTRKTKKLEPIEV